MGMIEENPKPIVVEYDWEQKEEPILNLQCTFLWFREGRANCWVRCTHQTNNHPDRHEFEQAWVVVGAEAFVQHGWVTKE